MSSLQYQWPLLGLFLLSLTRFNSEMSVDLLRASRSTLLLLG